MLCAIPMEILDRELDGVLYLALHLAKQGMPVLFGERMVHEYLFRINAGSPVVYFDQDQNEDVNRRIVDEGGLVVNLNAEGQNIGQSREIIQMFTKVAPTFSAMFVRGEVQKGHLVEAFPADRKDCVIATGHPSFDLLHSRFAPYYRSDELLEKVGGNYIQVNTQFATFNHKMGLDNYLRMISRMKEWRDVYTSDAFLEDLRRLAASEERTANAFVEMVRRVAEVFPEKRVVVRPHPMEGREFYLSGLSGIANVLVTNEGPVRPWLASADAVIHHSCTTGVEALLMNKNVIRFTPYQDGASCNMQANVGKKTETVDELIQALRQGAMPSEERAAQLDLIRPHVANCTELATPQIASHVARLAGEEPTWLPEPLSPWEAAKAWRKHFSKVLRSHQPGRNGRKVRYALEKFPRLTLSRINSLIRTIRSCDQDIPEVDVAELGLNVFLLKPATADNQRKNHGI